jgi:hypothetical protein
MRGGWGLTIVWVVSQACLLAQADGTQRLAALLIPARGQLALAKEQAAQIRAELLAWTDEQIRRGLTIAQLNEQLAASGLLVPEALYKTDDIYQPFAGYLEKITSEPIPSASDLLRVDLHIGMTCSFDQTAVIYRRNPLQRVGWINYADTDGSVAWKIDSITVGTVDSDGERIVAAGQMHAWCTSNYGSIELDIWKLTASRMEPLLERGIAARRDDPVTTAIQGNTVTFRYDQGMRDIDILIRPGTEKYRVDKNRVIRVAPVAVNIVGFIEEWLDLDDSEAAQWSSAEGVRERSAAVAWAKDGVEYKGGSRCAGSPRLWQVSVKLADSEDRRIFLVNEDGAEHLQMAGFRSEPVRECPHVDVTDLAKELSQ